jgi:N utilization substance protein A
MDLKQIIQAVNQITEEKSIDPARVYDAIEGALAAAYKKEYSDKSAIIRAKLNAESGDLQFFRVKEVVDDTMVRFVEEGAEDEEAQKAYEEDSEIKPLPRYNAERHILIEDAKKEKKGIAVGEEMIYSLPSEFDFGRIASQTAKQVILQKLREAERDSIALEFKDKEGKIVGGLIQRVERGNVFVDLGRTMGIMLRGEGIPGEHYRVGDRARFYVSEVQTENVRGSGILLSRAHPKFVGKLFEVEVPEIADGAVEIKSVAREAGFRTKLAVFSDVAGVDPVGSCVGQRGTRVMTVTSELGNEKLDIILWDADPKKFIASALSPAKVHSVEVSEDTHEAQVVVADDQLSLAIGKGGQNVRLAAKLTGWKIDVRAESKPESTQEAGTANEDGELEEVEIENGSDATETPVYRKPEEDEE